MKCPSCSDGKISGISFRNGGQWIEIGCPVCRGTAEISEEQARWVAEGQRLHDYRVGCGLGLRAGAEKWGIRPSTLSAMEQGAIDNSSWRGFAMYSNAADQKLQAITAAIKAYRETGSNPDKTIRSIESVLEMEVAGE